MQTIHTLSYIITATPFEHTGGGITRTGLRIIWKSRYTGKIELDHVIWDENTHQYEQQDKNATQGSGHPPLPAEKLFQIDQLNATGGD